VIGSRDYSHDLLVMKVQMDQTCDAVKSTAPQEMWGETIPAHQGFSDGEDAYRWLYEEQLTQGRTAFDPSGTHVNSLSSLTRLVMPGAVRE
jgi:hypothetical protein